MNINLPQYFIYFFATLISFLLITLYKDLGKENVNVDQFKWYSRSENFFTAFQGGDYKNTYQQYHPGISLIYIIRAGQVSFNQFINKNLSLKEITFENAGRTLEVPGNSSIKLRFLARLI